jgi:hypothetical protein
MSRDDPTKSQLAWDELLRASRRAGSGILRVRQSS